MRNLGRLLYQQYGTQFAVLVGVVLAFTFVASTGLTLWVAVPLGIVIIYLTVLVMGLLFGYLLFRD